MANTKKFVAKNGLQTQNLDFVSNNESNTVTISIEDSGILSIEGNIKISGSVYDSNNFPGTSGQILTSTETGIEWTSIEGVSGYSGTSGYSGVSGYSGDSGISGYSGLSGFSGYSGQDGANGLAGDSGFSGYSGTSGYSGLSGFSGTSGYSGISGWSGFSGDSGQSGFSGYSGISGDSGYSGQSGFSGTSGISGYSGRDGQFGGASFYYTYDFNLYGGNVSVGYVTTDSNVSSNITFIALNDIDRFGSNIHSFIQTIDDSTSDIKGYAKLTEEANNLNFIIFAIIGNHTDHLDHTHIPVSYVSGVTYTPSSNSNTIITFTVTGDKGDQGESGYSGTSGFSGFSGPSGISGYSGSSGISGYSGLSGWSGFSGQSGFSGSVGTTGTSGFSGYSGQEPVALRKTSNYTAIAGEIIIADTSGGTFTITLPAAPSIGNKVRIYDGNNWANNSLTIARNGSTIEGFADDFSLNIGQIYVDFVYDGTNWQLFGSIGKSGYSGYSGTSAQAIEFDGGTPSQDYTNGPGFDAGSVT